LINTFVKLFSSENNKPVDGVDERARARLYNYNWPGNIRELRNCIESAVVMTKGPMITEEDLPPTLRSVVEDGWILIPAGSTMDKAEEIIIRKTLASQNGNKSETAKILNIGRKTLHRKLIEWDGAELIGDEID
jgi:DNA-binding NtrC family response regulator